MYLSILKKGGKYIAAAICLLVIINFFAFFPVLTAEFLNWDDEENVVFHRGIRNFGSDSFIWIFSDFTVGDFKPLAWISYGFDYKVWRLNPFGYHLTNLFVHIMSGIMVLMLFYFLGSRIYSPENIFLLGPALLAALFFSIHPMRVESVGWISERKDVLCGFFFLAATLSYLKYAIKRRCSLYLLTWVLALAAMLSKPMAVTFPLIMILIDCLLLSGITQDTGRSRPRIIEKVPFFILTIIVGTIAFYGQSRHEALVPVSLVGPWERAILFCNTLAFYIFKTILPVRISAAYPAAELMSRTAWMVVPTALMLFTLTVIIIRTSRRNYGPVFFWLWFVIIIFPVGGVLPTGMVVAADRFTYLPSIGIAGLLFLGMVNLWSNKTWRRVFLFFPVGVACLVFLSFRQAGRWRNSESLWRNAVNKYPATPISLAHLGQLLYQKGEDEPAIDYLRASLAAMDEESLARGDIIFAVKSNLARALGRSGYPTEGAEILKGLLKDRDDWVTHHSLAGMYAKMGMKEEAILEYGKVIASRPTFVPALCEQGLLLAQSGMPDQAISIYKRALSILPDSPRTRYNLSLAFLDQGDPERAIGILESLAMEYPGRWRVAEALLIAYQVAGKDEAEKRFRDKLEKKPLTNQDQLPYSKGERPDFLIPIK